MINAKQIQDMHRLAFVRAQQKRYRPVDSIRLLKYLQEIHGPIGRRRWRLIRQACDVGLRSSISKWDAIAIVKAAELASQKYRLPDEEAARAQVAEYMGSLAWVCDSAAAFALAADIYVSIDYDAVVERLRLINPKIRPSLSANTINRRLDELGLSWVRSLSESQIQSLAKAVARSQKRGNSARSA